jgi:DNA-binding FrmR family transcriptional regulator
MVQEPRLCIEILQQLAAAEAALNRVSLEVFRFHVDVCVPNDIAADQSVKEERLTELVEIFDRFTKDRI